MQNKRITADKFRELLHDGMSIMFGGFMGVGTPEYLVTEIMRSGVKALTLIGNDTAFVDKGIGPLISNGQVKKVIASHIGTNPETGKKMISGELDVQLVPQGTLAEQIRAGGAGLGDSLRKRGWARWWKKINKRYWSTVRNGCWNNLCVPTSPFFSPVMPMRLAISPMT